MRHHRPRKRSAAGDSLLQRRDHGKPFQLASPLVNWAVGQGFPLGLQAYALYTVAGCHEDSTAPLDGLRSRPSQFGNHSDGRRQGEAAAAIPISVPSNISGKRVCSGQPCKILRLTQCKGLVQRKAPLSLSFSPWWTLPGSDGFCQTGLKGPVAMFGSRCKWLGMETPRKASMRMSPELRQ